MGRPKAKIHIMERLIQDGADPESARKRRAQVRRERARASVRRFHSSNANASATKNADGHPGDALSSHADHPSRRSRKIDDAACDVGPTIVDPHIDGAAGCGMRDAHARAEGSCGELRSSRWG